MTRRCVVRLTLCVTNVAKFNQLLRLLRPSLISPFRQARRPSGSPPECTRDNETEHRQSAICTRIAL
jgi:hypothetical protein